MSQENKPYRFEKYTGQEQEVLLPDMVEGQPLRIIGSKAFLSCKTVEKLYLPGSLEVVEDWGFAHMKNLREITMPAKQITFGKQVFLGCDKLRKINLLKVTDAGQQDATIIDLAKEDMQWMGDITSYEKVQLRNETKVECYEGIPYFLASMFRFFPEDKLENPALAGQWQWLVAYDAALLTYMKRPHDYSFEPAFIGWFDIEDVDDQKEKYMIEQRKHKVRLAFQRLQYDQRLSEADAQYLNTFLLEESDLIEEMLLEKKKAQEDFFGQDISYYKIWQQSGGLDRLRAERLLQQLTGEEPEIRGYLLNMQLETAEVEDFFQGLDL